MAKGVGTRFIQLVAAQWNGNSGNTYSLYALGDDGEVYRLIPSMGAWKRVGRSIATDEDLARHFVNREP